MSFVCVCLCVRVCEDSGLYADDKKTDQIDGKHSIMRVPQSDYP